MTTKITTAITMALALIVIVPARAEIASKAYVDDRNNMLIFGTTEPNSDDLEYVEQNGGVYEGINAAFDRLAEKVDINVFRERLNTKANTEELEKKVDTKQGLRDAFLVTNDMGNVVVASGGYIENDNISSSANIELGKLAMPLPGNDCETNGCMLMYYNGKYVWEVITRDTNESVSTTGYVNATPQSTTTQTLNANVLLQE